MSCSHLCWHVPAWVSPAAPGHLSRTWCCSQVTPERALSHLQLGQSHTSGARATHLARPQRLGSSLSPAQIYCL